MSENIHLLKCVQPYFNALRDEVKNFEVRKDDRNYAVGDVLVISEWTGEKYTGFCLRRTVKYILRDFPGLQPGWIVMGVE